MRSVKDFVLIHLEKKSDDTYQIGEHTLYLYNGLLNLADGSYNPETRKRIYGTVASVPDQLSGDGMDFSERLLRDVPMDVRVGDKCYYYYNILNDENLVLFEGKLFLRVRYDNLICVVRDGAVIPVSGHILLTRKKKVESAILYQVEKEVHYTAEVKHVSSPYIGDPELGFEPGDTVHYLPNCDFENKIELVEYLCIRQEYILAKQEA